ncbi:MAG: ribonucleoside-diphosphate reductase subunit alpha [Chloracidobacterium sp.]|nr:ribonucleoside-diphosphate reductase subunit alpha [Chloracidobacterium sp.]MBK7801169.1 ribonucleoside-diphosphate reductase subunit alpha [Chloracidobacterium sp.]MBK9436490.1 ribonucleoside-diphosphate reductase subunit alpha [Chloracidobacterium sp.]MBL0241473.1 ribonucleoside-diphosphate reductase subunit alpha [Chloracidobacterium sp.]
MQVLKRNGSLEPVDINKIVRAITRCCVNLPSVDSLRIATKTISGLYDGATTKELDKLSIQTAASLIFEEPEYSRLGARLLNQYVEKEVRNQEIHSFSQSIAFGVKEGLIGERVAKFVIDNSRKLNDAIDQSRNDLFEFFGLRTLYDRYLLKNPETRDVIETPQFFWMRVACGLAESPYEAIDLYHLFSSLEYVPSTPTLFNSGTRHEQLSSCFLLDSPLDSLDSIYKKYADVAMLSKFSGGIGIAYHRVRSQGSLIRGTNGHSNGIVPWLKTLDSSVSAVNQGGKRKGACCVYLETWHADIDDFLELRDNTGDEARRTHNLNLANWIPDLFMKRVQADGQWSLFDPKVVPHFPDLYGDDFEAAYVKAEEDGLFMRQINARDLYAKMMRTMAQTGNGWMTFKDACNRKSNQTALPENVVHLSNLCTEIIEVTSDSETAVCNLGSINASRYVRDGQFDFDKLRSNVRLAVRQLDKVIDLNYYAIQSTADSNNRWRNIGLGVMGLQDVFFQMRLPFDSDEARKISAKIQEEIYFAALDASADLAVERGMHPAFADTRAAHGDLQFDFWGVTPDDLGRWDALREKIISTGLRNSLMIAIAPTATIASIAGCYECIEPQVSNLFKRETLSGDFVQINKYLVRELKTAGLWTDEIRNKIKLSEGSVQDIDAFNDELKAIYRTAWEIPMRSLIDMAADRGAFIDQSASLNLFMESPNIGKLSSMYMYAWQKGLKTTYYLRSRPATRIAQVAAADNIAAVIEEPKKVYTDEEALVCSLENPEACEACQ